MEGFSLKITEQVIEFYMKCRIEEAARVAVLPERGSFLSLLSVVASVKDIQTRFVINVCGDVELDEVAPPALDYALSTHNETFVIMGMSIWNTVNDSDIWRVRIEKQISKYLAEVEDCHIFSYISQQQHTTKISFSWNMKL
jgi:hypothetical protein